MENGHGTLLGIDNVASFILALYVIYMETKTEVKETFLII